VDNIGNNLWVGVVNIGEHNEVSVTGLVGDTLGPVLVVSQNAEDCRLVVAGIIVCPAEMLPVIFLAAVPITSTREIKAEPGVYLVWFSDLL